MMERKLLAAAFALLMPIAASAQVPVAGVTGTMPTGAGLYDGGEAIAIKTVDGIEHLVHGKKDSSVRDANGLHALQAVVSKVDLKKKEIELRLPDASVQTMTLSKSAVAARGKELTADAENGTSVIVYYDEDGNGHQVAHYFERVKS
jgi:hypothetical protein